MQISFPEFPHGYIGGSLFLLNCIFYRLLVFCLWKNVGNVFFWKLLLYSGADWHTLVKSSISRVYDFMSILCIYAYSCGLSEMCVCVCVVATLTKYTQVDVMLKNWTLWIYLIIGLLIYENEFCSWFNCYFM